MRTTETQAECPHCKTHLLRLDDLPGVLAGCRACGGVWLDNALSAEAAKTPMSNEVHDFVSHLVSNDALGSRTLPSASDARTTQPEPKPKRACPVCRGALRAVKVRDPEMVVDVCPQHGTFFDRNELEALHHVAARNLELAQLSQQIDAEQAVRDREWASSQAMFNGGLIGAALMAASYEQDGSR